MVGGSGEGTCSRAIIDTRGDKKRGVLDVRGNSVFLTQTTTGIYTYRPRPRVVPTERNIFIAPFISNSSLIPLDDYASLPRVWHPYHENVFELQNSFLL